MCIAPKRRWSAPFCAIPPCDLIALTLRSVVRTRCTWRCARRWCAERVSLHIVFGTACALLKATGGAPRRGCCRWRSRSILACSGCSRLPPGRSPASGCFRPRGSTPGAAAAVAAAAAADIKREPGTLGPFAPPGGLSTPHPIAVSAFSGSAPGRRPFAPGRRLGPRRGTTKKGLGRSIWLFRARRRGPSSGDRWADTRRTSSPFGGAGPCARRRAGTAARAFARSVAGTPRRRLGTSGPSARVLLDVGSNSGRICGSRRPGGGPSPASRRKRGGSLRLPGARFSVGLSCR
jgi:hypothetical protein